MRVVVVYRQNTDYSRSVETFVSDFTRQTGRTLETVDPDSLDGITFCSSYDIIEYPSVIALSHDGPVQNIWKSTMLPTISEVSYYATQN